MRRRSVHEIEEKYKPRASLTATQPPGSSGNSFLKSWAWKREHRLDKDRFQLPYKHKLNVEGKESTLTIKPQPFQTTGFRLTVLSKYIEKWPALLAGKWCLELGASCSLPGIVCACFGAKEVVLTDLLDNLPLLRTNAAPAFLFHASKQIKRASQEL